MSDFTNSDHVARMRMRDLSSSQTIGRLREGRTIKTKKINDNATIPTRAHESDAGWDLYALEDRFIQPQHRALIKTGISFSIPDGYVGLIWPRSGLAVKRGIDVLLEWLTLDTEEMSVFVYTTLQRYSLKLRLERG